MRNKILSVTKAKARLLELARRVSEEGEAYILTRDGEPVSALVPMEDYESILETSDIRADCQTMKDLQTALEDERQSRLWKRDKSGKWLKARKSKEKASG
jgi:prevent-host-death family protein